MITDEEFPQALTDKLMSFRKDEIIEIMLDALENMQAYNGQSIVNVVHSSIVHAPANNKNGGH